MTREREVLLGEECDWGGGNEWSNGRRNARPGVTMGRPR